MMERSWLVQRLETPFGGMLGGGIKDNPFSFGGGYKNGGLSDNAMNLLRDIFSFDYMGAAEFEFGAVPKALGEIAKLADKKKLRAFTIQIPYSDIPDTSYSEWRKDSKKRPAPEGTATIHALCAKGDVDEVQGRIRAWAAEGYRNDLKEGTLLARVLRPPEPDEYPSRVAGWLELDNGFMFFTSEEMWRKTCELFGVKVPDVVPAS